MSERILRVDVTPVIKSGMIDTRARSVAKIIPVRIRKKISNLRTSLGYTIKGDFSEEQAEHAAKVLFSDPITEQSSTNGSIGSGFLPGIEESDITIQVGYKAGVTDNKAMAAEDGLRTVFPDKHLKVASTVSYHLWLMEEDVDLSSLTEVLHNPMLEQVSIISGKNRAAQLLKFPSLDEQRYIPPNTVNLDVDDSTLMDISENGLLALNLEEMKAIQSYYRNKSTQTSRETLNLPPHSPTDVELECLAQTWSEHCSHKIFSAKIEHIDTETGEKSTIDSLFKTHIVSPTSDISNDVDWLLSVFHDNSGVIAWTDDWSLCMKAETHNSPSALDPYGGAMTGIVGVNRDIMGTGLGARPIANTDVFCFGPPGYSGPLPKGLFHPSRIFTGVHAGVRSGGNESGIPTVNGAIVFDERYIGKPLVYCGTVGIMPRYLPDGRESHVKTPSPGDLIYMVGGRVGSDGIHGATFSSLELTEQSPSSAVQIGDPITQKKMMDMILEARDQGLIQVITDNGAGGLSSSVGEMAELTGGATIELGRVPLKQQGLSSWEILVSESQERMTVGIRKEDARDFEKLADLHEVDATPIGKFTKNGHFQINHNGECVGSLPIDFLHEGCPQLELHSEWVPPVQSEVALPRPSKDILSETLVEILSRPNVASKEWWVRSYDHEVIGQTVVKPFVGENHDAPGDAAVIAPIPGSTIGAVISNGIVPRYSDIDAYSMTAAAIDEAVRNAVCVGVDLEMIAGLDNFCWPDPIQSEKTPDGKQKLAQLVRSNRALEDVCRAYRLPCISGKDSMKNDAVIDGRKISVPPTLLFSLIGRHRDITKSVTSDFKSDGDIIYLLGLTEQEIDATELAYMLMERGEGGIGNSAPKLDPVRNMEMYRALTKAMERKLVRSAHDCSDGGLSVCLAESCFGHDGGAHVDVSQVLSENDNLNEWGILFGESLGRIVVSVSPQNSPEFEKMVEDHAWYKIGTVTHEKKLVIVDEKRTLLESDIESLKIAWKGTLDGGH